MTGIAVAGSKESGRLTDDAQMMLFTAEGLILTKVRADYNHPDDIPNAVFHSLLRWLYTENVQMLGPMMKEYGSCSIVDGILLGHKELFISRDPSETCLEALSRGTMGTFEYPVNNSRGKGALVRNLIIGTVFKKSMDAFKTAAACAVSTHGHPEAYLSAGFLAAMVSGLMQNQEIEAAMDSAIDVLKTFPNHEDVLETVYEAKSLSMRMRPYTLDLKEFFPDPTALHTLGTGIFYTLTAQKDIEAGLEAMIKADISDEACAIFGGVAGTKSGTPPFRHQLENLELSDIILELGEDLHTRFL